jgi:hypothetical protein
VLKWGAHSEKGDQCLQRDRASREGDFKISPDYTVDGVISRLEGVLVREYEKGGTAATIKAAMDRAIDQLQPKRAGHGTRLAMWLSGPPTNSVA